MENCSIVNKPAIHLVGLSYCGPYSTFPDEVIALQTQFSSRKHELSEAKKPSVLICPQFANEVLATYCVCLEVKHLLEEVPDKMVQFTIPAHQYAMTLVGENRVGEGYEQLMTWMNQQQLRKNEHALSIEIYHTDSSMLEEGQVELLIPFLDKTIS
ncbi:GyrI-like domain-containing protein [Paenibacillus yanchengensis]|uniref:GyrI-like domain-containing protein n=1 Tax=Paenibacillus yanchengensis TaxID=2035833 RepID=A0ABW4YKQ3_9BACL